MPPPPATIRSWPLIGDPLHRFWQLASTNLEQALARIAPQLTAAGHWLLGFVGAVSLGFLQFVVAIFIAAALLANAAGGERVADDVATGLAGTQGRTYADLAVQTIRSVARGIIGVALIQSILAGLGFLAVGLPAAGLLALVCLLLAIIQLPVGLVLVPAAIYGFTAFDTTTAVIFAVWCALVSLIDNVLRPLLLGRGVDLPMLVVFIGAIGGLLSSGILGLFVGPVVLALGYTLVTTWLRTASLATTADARAETQLPPGGLGPCRNLNGRKRPKSTARSCLPILYGGWSEARRCASLPMLPTRAPDPETSRSFGHRGGSNATGRRRWPQQ